MKIAILDALILFASDEHERFCTIQYSAYVQGNGMKNGTKWKIPPKNGIKKLMFLLVDFLNHYYRSSTLAVIHNSESRKREEIQGKQL